MKEISYVGKTEGQVLEMIQLQEARKRLEVMISKGLEETFVRSFEKGDVAIFENLGKGFDAVYYSLEQNISQAIYANLKQKISEFEEEYKAKVYLVQLTHLNFGDCYSFFFVSQHQEEWEFDNNDLNEEYTKDNYTQCVYVWNKDCEEISEFGSITFKYSMGGITRTA